MDQENEHLKALPGHEQEKIRRIQEVFAKLDIATAEFQKNSGLRCAEGCGKCCENPNVETTVLEVLPLAYALWQANLAEDALQKISVSHAKSRCVFYRPDPQIDGNGRCSVYHWRPLVCRLFGFSIRNDKHGKAAIMTCPTMKSLCASEYQAASEAVNKNMAAPAGQDFGMQVMGVDPYLGKEQMPINQAVKLALERAAMYLRSDQ